VESGPLIQRRRRAACRSGVCLSAQDDLERRRSSLRSRGAPGRQAPSRAGRKETGRGSGGQCLLGTSTSRFALALEPQIFCSLPDSLTSLLRGWFKRPRKPRPRGPGFLSKIIRSSNSPTVKSEIAWSSVHYVTLEFRCGKKCPVKEARAMTPSERILFVV
jgi:hypothetical protein